MDHLCLGAILLIATVEASMVKFEASPIELKANLTEYASMRCSIASGSTARVTSSDVDVRQVSSILVTRNGGQDVASVTSVDQAMTFVDPGNLDVKGSISGVSGEGFIELSWSNPSQMYLGEYKCDVTAIDGRGHLVQLTSQLEMTAVSPSINDVIAAFNMKHIKQQEQIESQKQDISNRKTENERLKQELQDLTLKYDGQHQLVTKDIADLKVCTSPRVAFTVAFKTTVGIFHIDVGHIAMYDKILLNNGGGYDISTGEFKCQTSGLYSFEVHALSYIEGLGCLTLQHNGAAITSLFCEKNDNFAASTGAVLDVKMGDVVRVVACYNSGFWQQGNNKGMFYQTNTFQGHLIQGDTCLS